MSKTPIPTSLLSFRSILVTTVLAGAMMAMFAVAQRHITAAGGDDNEPLLPNSRWHAGDRQRPQPPMVAPGKEPSSAPADAVVLFDGKDLSQWEGGKPEGIEDGCINIRKTGQIHTQKRFGDCQLHIEWAVPAKPDGNSYDWGNSGIFFLNDYELQIIESRTHQIYADGIAGALYNQTPPLVNASRKPGEWEIFDIVFEAPRFDGDKLVSPGYFTVFWNGVLVQNHTALMGDTKHGAALAYRTHATTGPIMLQYHNSSVRFRNIWLRPLSSSVP
jgi:hypothetical protein